MNKNYYDILQVNRNASPEIIEKAYKTLAKKYHPDLQAQKDKKQAEEILKEINEAYETLSNPEKKQNYDTILGQQEEPVSTPNPSTHTTQISEEELLYQQQQEILRKQKLQQEILYQEQLRREQEIAYQQQLQQARAKAYHDAYIQDLKNRGYKIRYKKSLKDYARGFFIILIVLFVFFLLWQLPFVKNFFMDFFQKNPILQKFVSF